VSEVLTAEQRGTGTEVGRRRDPIALRHTECGRGRPVVLIMGINADAGAWAPHTEQWQRSFRCIAVDNPGAGSSPAPTGPDTTAAIADDYAALIARLRLGPVAVVGISMGGAVAQELALRHPELVERLVLVASWARCDPYTDTVLEVIGALRRQGSPAEFTAHLQSLVWTPRWFDEHADELRTQRSQELSVPASALAGQVAACRTHDTADRLGAVAVPTLVTAGGADRFVPPEASLALARGIPGARFELFADTGHVHHWEEVGRFNDLVEAWIRG
jgi:pimeloyl-ACP methyl ester carboxylesterase